LKLLRSLGALAAAALTFTVSAHGSAYCLTRTCDPGSGTCQVDSHNCIVTGKVLYWPNSCVSFDVQKDGSPKLGIDYDTVHAVAVMAFQQWVNADCGNGTHPSIQIADDGPIVCSKPEYNKTEGNANVVTFHDAAWPYVNTADTLALTTVFFDGDTGEIYDANVEINSNEYDFTQGSPAGGYDLNAVLTHEFGHFLGLSHSDVETATMFSQYMPDMATLDPDDELGICLSLPPDRVTVSSDCTPRHGFSSTCGTPQSGCCATAVGLSASTNQTLGLLAFGLGLCAWRCRLRFRRAAHSARAPRR
jgi:Matrixin